MGSKRSNSIVIYESEEERTKGKSNDYGYIIPDSNSQPLISLTQSIQKGHHSQTDAVKKQALNVDINEPPPCDESTTSNILGNASGLQITGEFDSTPIETYPVRESRPLRLQQDLNEEMQTSEPLNTSTAAAIHNSNVHTIADSCNTSSQNLLAPSLISNQDNDILNLSKDGASSSKNSAASSSKKKKNDRPTRARSGSKKKATQKATTFRLGELPSLQFGNFPMWRNEHYTVPRVNFNCFMNPINHLNHSYLYSMWRQQWLQNRMQNSMELFPMQHSRSKSEQGEGENNDDDKLNHSYLYSMWRQQWLQNRMQNSMELFPMQHSRSKSEQGEGEKNDDDKLNLNDDDKLNLNDEDDKLNLDFQLWHN